MAGSESSLSDMSSERIEELAKSLGVTQPGVPLD
jgi:hypothetical protein